MPRSKEVDAWLARYDNPMKPVVERLRALVLAADARIDECIKWQAPTFTYKGNLASFFPKSKKHVSLMFHQGASIPGQHPVLAGDAETGRSARFVDATDIEANKAALEAATSPRASASAGTSTSSTRRAVSASVRMTTSTPARPPQL